MSFLILKEARESNGKKSKLNEWDSNDRNAN